MIVPLAHAGHMLVDLPVFFGPVIVLVAWLFGTRLSDARRERSRGDVLVADERHTTRWDIS
jgi:hypothetical protein